MSLYRKLSRQPKQFLSLTGMNLHQFQELLPQLTEANRRLERERKAQVVGTQQKRERGIGGGAKACQSARRPFVDGSDLLSAVSDARVYDLII